MKDILLICNFILIALTEDLNVVMEENNKRIAKNTIYLYIRMLVIMALSFVTTRIVLDKLGASDYGIYNLVGGFVAMFVVFNNILNGSTSRFIALSLGKSDIEYQKKTFSTAFLLHLFIAITIVALLEVCGIWFLNTKLNIELDRVWAARWVFHIAVFQVFWSITQTPFSALVTAHEHFNMYAIMSIYDVVAKLLVLFLLVYIPLDKLVIYALLQMLVSITSIIVYRFYCIHKFEECSFSLIINKHLAKEMLVFSGWGALGHVIITVNGQGTSIILNLFFNTVMNAARGLANTVNFTIAQFVSGFMTASQPQLVKFWGAGDKSHFEKLIFNVSQYSLFLLAIIGVPALLEIEFVINLWLGDDIPPYTVDFVKISLICSVIYRSSSMLDLGLNAAGLVKQQNLISIPLFLLSLPLVYIVLSVGLGPLAAYWVSSFPPFLAFLANLLILKKYIGFSSMDFFVKIFIKNILLIAISLIVPYYFQSLMEPSWLRFLLVCFIAELVTFIILYKYGLNREVRESVQERILDKIKRFHI